VTETLTVAQTSDEAGDAVERFDAIVIGAGVSGLYQVYCLREAGLSVRCFDEAGGIGGVWYWNRYPGCAFDGPSELYGYTFSKELQQEWDWKDYYSRQPDTEEYVNFVADKFDLRRHVQLNTRVTAATWHEEGHYWEVELESGERARASFLVGALGAVALAFTPPYPGAESFKGQQFHTGRWPREDPDFTGKRVAVIGTGSTGMQVIPEVAKLCGHLTVFQRTPGYGIPADNAPVDPEVQREWKESLYEAIRKEWREASPDPETGNDPRSGHDARPQMRDHRDGHDVPKEERLVLYEEAWQRRGTAKFVTLFSNLISDRELNAEYAEFVRGKIRGRVDDPALAEKLMPTIPFGAKRVPLEEGYYEAFNRDNVTLVDVRETPVERVTETGIVTSEGEHEVDIIIYATGYDTVTGGYMDIPFRGVDGLTLKEKWQEQPFSTFLGLTSASFPNFFICSPVAVCIHTPCVEWICEWAAELIVYMRERGLTRMEPTQEAEDAWGRHHDDVATRVNSGEGDEYSIFLGKNIPGKKTRRYSYAQTGPVWRARAYAVAEKGYEGFVFDADPSAPLGSSKPIPILSETATDSG
jgi:cation diffusion facilitator CzcD-associated flavoprotein CzcO